MDMCYYLYSIGGDTLASRMERYYEKNNSSNSRTVRNENLYKNLYSTNDYLSSVATLDKTNEIEIEKIKELIKDRETYQKQKETQMLYPKKQTNSQNIIVDDDQEKKYDIKDALLKAKEERKNVKENYRKNQYEYLLTSNEYSKKLAMVEEENDKLTNLLKTIINNDELNKLSNTNLSLELLNDLKSDETINNESESTSIKKIINEEKKEEIKEEPMELDKSFYTTSLNFSDKDFDLENSFVEEKNNNVIKIILGIVLVLITIATVYVIFINV